MVLENNQLLGGNAQGHLTADYFSHESTFHCFTPYIIQKNGFIHLQIYSIRVRCQLFAKSWQYLALPVTWMMNRVRIETLKLVWWEKDASLVTFDLCKEILLLVIMGWGHVAFPTQENTAETDVKIIQAILKTKIQYLSGVASWMSVLLNGWRNTMR